MRNLVCFGYLPLHKASDGGILFLKACYRRTATELLHTTSFFFYTQAELMRSILH